MTPPSSAIFPTISSVIVIAVLLICDVKFMVDGARRLPVTSQGLRPKQLISYTGQPVQLSKDGLRSKEAAKAARYAAGLIVRDRVARGQMAPCFLATTHVLRGTSKVVAGIQYNLMLEVMYVPQRTPECRRDFNQQIPKAEVCDVEVIYQPYKPQVAELALVDYVCGITANRGIRHAVSP